MSILQFSQRHCKVTHYNYYYILISVKKCGFDSCLWCQNLDFQMKYFKLSTIYPTLYPMVRNTWILNHSMGLTYLKSFNLEASLSQFEQKSHGMPFSPSAQYAKNVGVVLQCDECRKWRVIYSKTVLSAEQKDELKLVIAYTCGSRLQEIEGSVTGLLDKVYVKANLTCLSPIEIPYYSAKYENIIIFNLRYHCGTTEELVISESNYLMCSSCIQENKEMNKINMCAYVFFNSMPFIFTRTVLCVTLYTCLCM